VAKTTCVHRSRTHGLGPLRSGLQLFALVCASLRQFAPVCASLRQFARPDAIDNPKSLAGKDL